MVGGKEFWVEGELEVDWLCCIQRLSWGFWKTVKAMDLHLILKACEVICEDQDGGHSEGLGDPGSVVLKSPRPFPHELGPRVSNSGCLENIHSPLGPEGAPFTILGDFFRGSPLNRPGSRPCCLPWGGFRWSVLSKEGSCSLGRASQPGEDSANRRQGWRGKHHWGGGRGGRGDQALTKAAFCHSPPPGLDRKQLGGGSFPARAGRYFSAWNGGRG